MRYAVDTDALRDDADAVDVALQRLERLGVAELFGSVAVGLPGSRVAGSAGRLGSAWDGRVADTRWMLRSLGGQLVAAAESYDAVERVVGQVLGHRAPADRAVPERAVADPAGGAPAVDGRARAGGR